MPFFSKTLKLFTHVGFPSEYGWSSAVGESQNWPCDKGRSPYCSRLRYESRAKRFSGLFSSIGGFAADAVAELVETARSDGSEAGAARSALALLLRLKQGSAA